MKQPTSPYVIQIELPENATFNKTASHTNQVIDAVMSLAPDAKITIQRSSIGSALADAANRATPVMLSLPETDQPTHPEKPKESLYFETSLDAAKWLVEQLHKATEQYLQHHKDDAAKKMAPDFDAYDVLWLAFQGLNSPSNVGYKLRSYGVITSNN